LSLPKDSFNTAACASILDDTEVGNEFPCFVPADSFALMLDDEMSNRIPIQATCYLSLLHGCKVSLVWTSTTKGVVVTQASHNDLVCRQSIL